MGANSPNRRGSGGSRIDRAFRRLRGTLVVRVYSDHWGAPVDLLCNDLGAGGLFVETASPPPVDSEIEIDLAPHDHDHVKVRAVVAHIFSSERALQQLKHPGFGAMFQYRDQTERAKVMTIAAALAAETREAVVSKTAPRAPEPSPPALPPASPRSSGVRLESPLDMALKLIAGKRLVEAEQLLGELQQSDPSSVRIKLWRLVVQARLHKAAGHTEQALAAYRRVLELEPSHHEAREVLHAHGEHQPDAEQGFFSALMQLRQDKREK